ncbi:MAG: HDOD domain-containing protein [Verrucomicrobiota bacterium]|nr:HDOD domain-containing protein [Verrucomicrobiota bacterium]
MNPLSDFVLIERINQCPKLASLQSINSTLLNLIESEDSFVSQIAEVIKLDPSLTTRVLDLVNSIFFGSTEENRINGIEEASIFLGLNRIRELLSATPIIEEITSLDKKTSGNFPWEDFWRHSIGCAILTRELLSIAEHKVDLEADYVAGLLHNLGILILAITFGDEFSQVFGEKHKSINGLVEKEKYIIGWDHAKIGAYYLWNHHISEEVVEAVNFHNTPHLAKINPKLSAAVHLSDKLVRNLGVIGLEKSKVVKIEDYTKIPSWDIIFPYENEDKNINVTEKLDNSLERLSEILKHIL